MNEIRLRRHADGRVALQDSDGLWYVHGSNSRWPTCRAVHDDDLVHEEWPELLVAELPEPDGHLYRYDKTIPFWDMRIGHLEVEDGEIGDVNWGRDVDELSSDALKMLAAVAACENFRAQREATT